MDSVVEERALREIYLATFERIVKTAKPSMVMESYNKVNGVCLAENRRLLTEVLKEEWGFEGVVISDWWAVNDRVDSFNAGLDLEMPQNHLNDRLLMDAVNDGTVSMEQLDDSCRRILGLILRYAGLEKVKADYENHHTLARRAAAESIVLLKNEGDLLPLDSQSKIAVIGSFAVNPRYQGVGCSIVNPRRLLVPLTEIKKKASNITYSPGYDDEHNTDPQYIGEAVTNARESDCVILFVGLPEEVETETHDREDYNLPESHVKLIKEVSAANPYTVVVLQNGSAVAMAPWISMVPAIIEGWLGGEAGAGAIADVLFGDTNPSGKLTITFPERIEDTPGYLNFPGESGKHIYFEGIFVGYRYYEKKRINPTFAFGFGLSYTRFKYSNLELDKETMTNEDSLDIAFTVSNIGDRAGKEVAQIYISPHGSRLKRPIKELKKFVKIPLEPGESRTVNVTISDRDFAYYDDHFKDWVVDSGTYTVMVGASSDDIRLSAEVMVDSSQVVFAPLTGESYCYNLVDNPVALAAFKEIMVRNSLWGEDVGDEFFEAIRHNFIPLFKSITRQTKGKISREEFDSWMDEVNRKTLESMKGRNKTLN
jgi:beta-glucosidase